MESKNRQSRPEEDVSVGKASAQLAIEQTEEIRLTGASAEFVASLLIDPPAVAPAMARALGHHERLIGKL